MNTIAYKITNFDETTGSLTILADGFPPFCIDLTPDESGQYVVGNDLDMYIRGFIPTWVNERLEKVKLSTNSNEIKALVQEVIMPTNDNTGVSVENANIAMIVRNVLAEEGLLP